MGSQDSHHAIKEPFQGVCGNGLDVGGNGVRAERSPDLSRRCVVLVTGMGRGGFVHASGAGAVSYFSAIEAHKPHEWLKPEYDGMYMPEKSTPCHDAHYIDENHRREFYIAFTLCKSGIEFIEQLHDPEVLQEVEELIKESGFTKAIDLRDVLALGKVFGNACLVSVSSAPTQTFSDVPGCPVE
jgi:hypothetical protein